MPGIVKILIIGLSTFFYVGYLPLVPGTFGSLAGLTIYLFLKNNPQLYLFITAILVFLGYAISGKAERIIGTKDARYIVIDEVCGMLICFLFLPFNAKLVIAGFFLFRLLDTLKPFPGGRLERYKGSVGIMSDDIVAGIYTNIILQVVFRLASFKIS
jgi:phosphatidylglycerophosphatase A